MRINSNDLEKLSLTGWQSWSFSNSNIFKFPLMNYSPKGKSSFIPKFKNKKNKKPAYGWCSWYAYGSDIDESKIIDQAKWIFKNKVSRKIPLEYMLIDGGWSLCGDWQDEDKTKFPSGLKNVAAKIKGLKLRPGIWIAPFLVHKKSRLAVEHPDWLVRDNGHLVEGLKLTPWDKFMPYGKWVLDIKKPEVIKYLDDTLYYLIKVCGFELVKLDFLYAIYFDPGLSETAADTFLNNFLSKIKSKYPNVYTIACGCPLIPAIGVVDSMRIGPDSLLDPFLNFLKIPFLSQIFLKSKVIPTIEKRLWTNKFWNIDPDAFMCRKTLSLSKKDLISFQKVIKSGKGNVFLGDDLTKLSSERLNKYVCKLFTK